MDKRMTMPTQRLCRQKKLTLKTKRKEKRTRKRRGVSIWDLERWWKVKKVFSMAGGSLTNIRRAAKADILACEVPMQVMTDRVNSHVQWLAGCRRRRSLLKISVPARMPQKCNETSWNPTRPCPQMLILGWSWHEDAPNQAEGSIIWQVESGEKFDAGTLIRAWWRSLGALLVETAKRTSYKEIA